MPTEYPDSWRVAPIEDCMEAIIDYRGKTPTKTISGVPLVTAKVVKSGRILKTAEFIAEDDYDAWMRRGLPKSGDVVITTEAPLGEVAQLDGSRVALGQRLITLRGAVDTIDNTFLKFILQGDFVQSQLRARSTGTTVLGIRQSELRKVRLPLPPMHEQRAIALILGALDDKIALNRRMNDTLEAMARALFKAWFVDFDPVKAKAGGEHPWGMDATTAALFPDRFEDSELGEVPQGWRNATLDDVATFTKGVSYKSSELAASNNALVTLKSFHRRGGYREDGLKPYTGRYKPEQVVVPGEVLVSQTDVTQAAEVIGRAVRVPASATYDILVGSLDTAIVRPKSGDVSNEYLYELLAREEFREHCRGYSNGTTVLHLNSMALPRYQFVLPSASVMSRFTAETTPLYASLDANNDEAVTLAVVRDTLLPRLLSGEVRLT